MQYCISTMEYNEKPLDTDKTNGLSSNANNEQQEIDSRIWAYQIQLRRLTSELSLAEARERREIASDLHDHTGREMESWLSWVMMAEDLIRLHLKIVYLQIAVLDYLAFASAYHT